MTRGFILHPSYRVTAGRPAVRIHGVLENGKSFLILDDRSAPRFWIREADEARARELGADVRTPDTPRRTMRGAPVVPVQLVRPSDAPAVRDKLIDHGIPTYEADVRFAYRYLIDRGIRASVEIRGESAPGEGVDAVFRNPDVRPADWSPELRTLSIDIETDPSAEKVLSIALVGCGVSDVLLMTPEGWSCPGGAVPFRTERDLLLDFVRRVRELDPDVLTGWNVVGFDFTVLERIAERCRVPLTIGRGPDALRIRPGSGPRASAEARIPGRVVLDGMDLVRGAFLRFESYSLNHVSSEVLGETKLIHGSDRAGEILRTFKEERETFVEYNRGDARLVLDILDRLELMDLTVERSRLTGMPPDRVAASIASFDFLYLSELGRRGMVAPTVQPWVLSEETAGGHVLEPEPGLHRNVLVLDFKSLYPSVIRTFNIDPLGYFSEPADTEDPVIAPNGARFRRDPGILPAMLDEFFPRREAAKKAGRRAGDLAIKILMNSFYGVLGSTACRFSAPALANAITGFGREILLWSKARFEKAGHRVLYGDTDSLFVEAGTEDARAARAIGERLVRDLNEELARHVREKWRVESKLELEFETLYRRLYLPAVRHGTAGARKRYAGLVDRDPEPELVFTGMEVVRRDWTELAKRVQRAMYARLFAEEPVEQYLHDIVSAVRDGEHDHELVYRKGLRKGLDSYTAQTPPHVQAARKMSGKPPWVIEYVITRDGPEPAAERKHPLDHEHYVQKQVRPVAEPVLHILGLSFDRVVGDDRQQELFPV